MWERIIICSLIISWKLWFWLSCVPTIISCSHLFGKHHTSEFTTMSFIVMCLFVAVCCCMFQAWWSRWFHPMCLLAGGFRSTPWSPSDPVTLWLTGEWHQWQAAPIPPGARVAPSEWMRVVGREIAFEPKKTYLPPSSILLFFSQSLCMPFSSLLFLFLSLFCSSELGAGRLGGREQRE